ncbi:MAG: efflux RND transporter periplasmic adaptor subunit, partial [Calditrichaeota bacterium]|nr:efflux RND transporter periplasmic adaptor subunit [Calditrichota bacterium]
QIPNKAIVYRDQRPVVFKVENDIAIWQYVDLGERFGDRVEITNGVDAGDKVITNGHFTLAHQANVNFKEVEPYQ